MDWITKDANTDNTLTLSDPLLPDAAVTFPNTEWGVSFGQSLTAKEIEMLRALIKILVDTDLYDTLMEKLEMDADSAMATAFKGGKNDT